MNYEQPRYENRLLYRKIRRITVPVLEQFCEYQCDKCAAVAAGIRCHKYDVGKKKKNNVTAQINFHAGTLKRENVRLSNECFFSVRKQIQFA